MPAHQYRNVIIPFTFLRRMDCLRRHEVDLGLKVAATEGEGGVAATSSDSAQAGPDETGGATDTRDSLGGLLTTVDEASPDAEKLLAEALERFARVFSAEVVEVLDAFQFAAEVRRLANASVLRGVVSGFAELDLSPDAVSDQEMGSAYEELVWRLVEAAPERSGEHASPRDVTTLAARLLLGPDAATLDRAGQPIAVHDPCCGTGGMFTAVEGTPAEAVADELVAPGLAFEPDRCPCESRASTSRRTMNTPSRSHSTSTTWPTDRRLTRSGRRGR
ncbi:hypothetical protein ADL01_35540 [Streptomyces sp. NRRL WC-3618]|nr:hypothetical protein ADL01_35540 [Streptomyces sp. NRRL WC-3618]